MKTEIVNDNRSQHDNEIKNLKNAKKVIWISVGILVTALVVSLVCKKYKQTKIKDIKHKIEQVQTKKETAIADSLRTIGINLEAFDDSVWYANRSINKIMQCENISNCPLGKLYSPAEIDRMDKDFQERKMKRAREMNPVSGFFMAISCVFISQNTTISELVRVLELLDPFRGQDWYWHDGQYYCLSNSITFPHNNPIITIDKKGDYCLLNSKLVMTLLSKQQQQELAQAMCSLHAAQSAKKVANDVREYFEYDATMETDSLLSKLGRKQALIERAKLRTR